MIDVFEAAGYIGRGTALTDALRAWTRFYSPVAGAHFVLEPHRPAEAQCPPLIALPDLRWTIDGEPADTWVPTPGTHRVVVARGATTDAIDIVYE